MSSRIVTTNEMKTRIAVLKLQRERLLQRLQRQKKREAFIRKNLSRIQALKMDGWPRLKNMKDRIRWIDLVYEAKIAGVYAISTANCDVIAQLNRFAKELNHKS